MPPQDDFTVPVSLSSICEGNLEEEFQRMYPELIAAINDPKDKASITITIALKRVAETTSMLTTAYSIKPTFPAIARSSMCRIGQGNKLQTIAAKIRQLTLVDRETGEINHAQ